MGVFYSAEDTRVFTEFLLRRFEGYSTVPHVPDLTARLASTGQLILWRPSYIAVEDMPADPNTGFERDEDAIEDVLPYLCRVMQSSPWCLLIVDPLARPGDPAIQRERQHWFEFNGHVLWLVNDQHCRDGVAMSIVRRYLGGYDAGALLLAGASSTPTESDFAQAEVLAAFTRIFDEDSLLWWTDRGVHP